MGRKAGQKVQRRLVVDSFAGGGGASTGIESALGRSVDIAINHNPIAMAMHKANHPDADHYTEDVYKVDPAAACAGNPVGMAWFSPDCKHFSKAKGGRPVSKRIRGLAWIVIRWAKAVRPDLIFLENVEEFEDWGPLTLDGYPDPNKLGLTFRRWRRQLEREGYTVEMKVLRASDYGGHTIRKRLYLVARCDGKPIVWREPTHGKGKKAYHTAAEIIDFSLPCHSIFLTKEEGRILRVRRPLKPMTMERIAKGIFKHVVNNPHPFIVPLTHHGVHRSYGIHQSLPTITGAHRGELALITPFITEHANASAQRNMPADAPLRTVCAQVKGGHFALVAPNIHPVTPGDREQLVAHFLAQHNGGFYEGAGRSMAAPLSTITGRGTQQQLVSSHLLKLKGTARTGASVLDPVPTVQAEGTHIGEVRAFLTKYYSRSTAQSLHDPLHTATSKDTFGLVYVYGDLYQIGDIGMRMLTPRELFAANDFPEDYIIDPYVTVKRKCRNGTTRLVRRRLTKTEQTQMCGNAVDPIMAEMLVADNYCQDEAQEAVA